MTTTVAEKGSVRVAGTEIAYHRLGEGRPLVVIHGGPGIGHAYLRALDVLAQGRQLVYYDQRGSGDSPTADPSRIGWAGSIADLDGLRQALGIHELDVLAIPRGRGSRSSTRRRTPSAPTRSCWRTPARRRCRS